MSEINKGLERLRNNMAIKSYLYREDEEVFKKIQDIKQRHEAEKFSTKDAITYLINKGYWTEIGDIPKVEAPLPSVSPEPTPEVP